MDGAAVGREIGNVMVDLIEAITKDKVAAAVAAERERCARIVETAAHRMGYGTSACTPEAVSLLAARIREGGGR